MLTITLEEAQSRLPEIIAKLAPGEDLLITRDSRPVARLMGIPLEQPTPIPGRCKGMLTILVEDEEHLEGWEEYMPEGASRVWNSRTS